MTGISSATQFSFLLPTRGNAAGLRRFFQSVVNNTSDVARLEIVLAVDDDDLDSQAITHETLRLKKVVLPRGATMGALNTACFEASTGRFVMGMNDDVLVRTPGWDRIIAEALARYPDDIVLIHVNDLLFEKQLCTFPLVSRRACEAIGFCPPEYRRHRIDDHIYDVYQLLAYLGHPRIVYLPDVVFEHMNYALERPASPFTSRSQRVYRLNESTVAHDASLFEQLFAQRKADARILAQLIDRLACEQKRFVYERLLATVTDSLNYREKDFVLTMPSKRIPAPSSPTVTVAVLTSDLGRRRARQCLSQLKKYTPQFEYMPLTNSAGDFARPRELNKALQMAKTDFVVLMDDDVWVEKEWLLGLINSLNEETGLVVPLHKKRNGALSFSGAYLLGDGTGKHMPMCDLPPHPRAIPCAYGALFLIDMRKCGHLRFDENYRRRFEDIDFSLKVWEAGYKVVCTPYTSITYNGKRAAYAADPAYVLDRADEHIFVSQWIKSGRLFRVEEIIGATSDYLRSLITLPQDITSFFVGDAVQEFDHWQTALRVLSDNAQPYPLFRAMLAERLLTSILIYKDQGDLQKVQYAELILKALGGLPVPLRWTRQTIQRFLIELIRLLKSNPHSRRWGRAVLILLERARERYPSLPMFLRAQFDPSIAQLLARYERAIAVQRHIRSGPD